jgi:protein SCO1/2
MKSAMKMRIRKILLLTAHCSLLTFLLAVPAQAHDDGRPLALRAVDFEQKLGEQAPLDADVGKEFEIVNVSFDPHDTPALAMAKKSDLVERYRRPGAADGWHFLSGGEASINRITEAAGFRYNYESENDRFAHATGIMLLTPQGRFARYFYGIEFSPRDLRLGLLEASDGKIGKAIDQLLLFCYHYDPATGKYTLMVTNVLRGATIATVLAIGAFIALALRAELSRRAG